MKIYCTKYLFTDGITVAEAEIKGDMAIVREGSDYPMFYHGEGKEWHKSRDGAVRRAEDMRIKKIQSLNKRIKKISAMVF